MEIHVREEKKLVEVWLTHEEKEDPHVREQLTCLYQQCKTEHYLAVEFQSGREDLTSLTSSLLCCNRNRIAHAEATGNRNDA